LLGSLITAQAADDVLAAQSKWQTIATETLHAMHQPLADHPSVVSPGLLAVEDSCLTDHEVFGPLLLVEQATDLDDAIARANKTRYGLSAGLLSDDLDAFRHFVQHIRAGIVNWNRQTTGASGRLPFGGIGWSGNHQPSGFFAADYCSYPVSSLETHNLALPETPHVGLEEIFPR
jgi:succinylglutamic semialdehyde dehydrogenase